MTHRILVIEDERELAELIEVHLSAIAGRVRLAFDGASGLDDAERMPFDLIILDLNLPDTDGIDVCRQLRARADYVPILMLTSRSSELDRVAGLEAGADDYMVKPFSVLELLARVKAIFRRVEAMSDRRLQQHITVRAGALVIDPERHSVKVGERHVELTAKEFELLLELARHPGRVFSREQLLDRVWGYKHLGYHHTVDSHINRLRAKLEQNPTEPVYVLTVWGVGYKFADLEPPAHSQR